MYSKSVTVLTVTNSVQGKTRVLHIQSWECLCQDDVRQASVIRHYNWEIHCLFLLFSKVGLSHCYRISLQCCNFRTIARPSSQKGNDSCLASSKKTIIFRSQMGSTTFISQEELLWYFPCKFVWWSEFVRIHRKKFSGTSHPNAYFCCRMVRIRANSQEEL